jgi:hypothetical protein
MVTAKWGMRCDCISLLRIAAKRYQLILRLLSETHDVRSPVSPTFNGSGVGSGVTVPRVLP